MSREEKLIIALLNEDYKSAEELLSRQPAPNYSAFLDLVYYHRVYPLIFSRILERFSTLLDKSLAKAFKINIMQQMTMNKMHRQVLIDAAGLLSEAGYEVTLMKGVSYDTSEKTTRVYGDVDLLVQEDKIREIIALLNKKGYRYKGSFMISREEKTNIEVQLSWNNQYQFACPGSSGNIEIHTNLFERDRIRLENITALLDNPDLYMRNRIWDEKLRCYVPCTEATLMLLCLQCSLKRSLYNNRFILRHITDMDILLDRGIDEEAFLSLCREGKIAYHVCYSAKLYSIIREKPLPRWYSSLEKDLSRSERFLLRRHLKCLKNLWSSRYWGRFIFNFTAPFIIGGSSIQRYTWIRNNILATKLEQEHRYYRWGFRKESPLIYVTYFINPFWITWQFIKKILGIKDKSSPEL